MKVSSSSLWRIWCLIVNRNVIWLQNSVPLWNSPFVINPHRGSSGLFKICLPFWKTTHYCSRKMDLDWVGISWYSWCACAISLLTGCSIYPWISLPKNLNCCFFCFFFLYHQRVLLFTIITKYFSDSLIFLFFPPQSTETRRWVLWTSSLPLSLERKGIFPRWQSLLPLLPVVCFHCDDFKQTF